MSAGFFAAGSLLGKVSWAAATLVLAGTAPTGVFAEYAFIQITSSIVIQVALGVFSNVITARLAQETGTTDRGQLAMSSALYGTLVCMAAFPLLLLLGALGIPHLGIEGALAIVALSAAVHVSTTANNFLAVCKHYGEAVALVVLQSASYIIAVLILRLDSGATLTLVVAAIQLAPSVVFLVVRAHGSTNFKQHLPLLLLSHRRSVLMNVSYLPSAVLLWLLTANIADSTHDMASYGLANQVANLFLFLPTSLAPLAISHLSTKGHTMRTLAVIGGPLLLLGLFGAAIVAAAAPVVSPLLPATISQSLATVSIGLAMAGLVGARSPFAWVNQLQHLPRAEMVASAVLTAVTATVYFWPDYGGEELMIARAVAAMMSLAVTLLAFVLHGAGKNEPR